MQQFTRTVWALALAATLLGATARPAKAQILTSALGTVAGTAAGGYITLAIVVARAQAGHYLHDVEDLFGWGSLPVIIGAGTGAALGFWAPERLTSGFIYGAGGAALGTGIGFLVGQQVSERPEGKWAGAAIGAGAGMAIGALIGMLNPKIEPPEDIASTIIPVGVRIRF